MSAVLSELANAASLKEGQRTALEQKEIRLAWFESERQKRWSLNHLPSVFEGTYPFQMLSMGSFQDGHKDI